MTFDLNYFSFSFPNWVDEIFKESLREKLAGIPEDIPGAMTPSKIKKKLPDVWFHNHKEGKILYILYFDEWANKRANVETIQFLTEQFQQAVESHNGVANRISVEQKENRILGVDSNYFEIIVDFDPGSFTSLSKPRKDSLLELSKQIRSRLENVNA